VAEDQDWRLQVELDVEDSRSALDRLVGRVREPDVVGEVEQAVSHDDVAITHDGKLLFAYAASEATLASARATIEDILRRDGVEARIRVSHWDEELDAWRQTDPPPTDQQVRTEEAVEREGERIETRTMIASSGKLVRDSFEQTMSDWARRLGVECAIVEHPHLLTTQVAFTVTGPKRKIEEFAQGLNAEGTATMRSERAVIFSPL
jgi:hypothetical protein